MIIKKIHLENFTVFEHQTIEFSPGINVIIGENGTGKTHLLKSLYSACQSADPKVSFPQKLVSTLLPDDYKISRLITRQLGNPTATIRVTAGENENASEKTLAISFNEETNKWNAYVTGEEEWENSFAGANNVFIPAKEILSHSFNLNAASEKNNVRFDDTYLDIINAAKIDLSVGNNDTEKENILKTIETITRGTVLYDVKRDGFYIKNGNSKQEFNLIADGIRKMGLLWQLIKNGALEKGSILFWDEPEANINPTTISVVVELLLTLHRRGVQIFLSTHDYMLASYFQVKKNKSDLIQYHSLFFDEDRNLQHCSCDKFDEIENNSIISAFNTLLNEIYALEV